ncbi:family 2 glycosyl hydrolase [Pseudomassariella vexata]|uniref:beta-galactosidase n=1 Tax=Pseudomassariella vexata TaxID=1141098 RepID=A0A1Y2DQG5_9PEZI|nr:family 2 glycosyl hydrolase [Pseudomassariella vexata]ORY61533.1 family 2 glycosyl hydrolase [Pseudomassariella vexata]
MPAELVIRTNTNLHMDMYVNSPDLEVDTRDTSLCGSSVLLPSASQTHVQPKHLPNWNNLKVIHRNTLTPRSHFFLYNSEKDALAGDVQRSRSLLLSGLWGFHLTNGPFNGPTDFFDPNFDNSKWDLIKVPGMWQLQGHGKGPQYTNVNYPFPVNPPHVPYDENECGRYVTKFAVPENLKDTKQWRLRFEGVDSAFSVYLNGKEIGYSQGSRNPSEFDITDALILDSEENYLAVEVYQWSDGSYIEDQDQWWLSGIFRDVWLHAFPSVHLEDFHVQTILDDDYKDAWLKLHVDLNQAHCTTVKLLDIEGNTVFHVSHTPDKNSFQVQYQVKCPHKWTAETPYLYTLVISVGEVYISHKIGFRRAELVDGVFCVNGNPVKFRGVNRHEHHPESGRAVPYEFLRRDLLLMKYFNINAIRTSHYINDTRLYDLANELGLWVISEADLECHGMGEVGGDPASFASDNPAWKDAYVDRARQMVMRDKNHPCIIMWSLGNESFYGRNHQAMYDEIKSIDDTRLIHYEGDQDAQTVDIFSRMYTSVDDMIKHAEEKDWKKPFVMCEYAHAMGNGPGAIKEYIDAFYKYPRLMGGFVWEWANHGLKTNNADGEVYMAYGGDFGEEVHDFNFVMDGLCFANHSPTPGLLEYSKAIEPVQVLGYERGEVEIINRFDFLDPADHLRCHWEIISDRSQVIGREVHIPEGIRPHTKAKMFIGDLGKFIGDLGIASTAEVWLRIEFSRREGTQWSYPGQLIAASQLQLTPPKSLAFLKTISTLVGPRVHTKGHVLSVMLRSGKIFGFNTLDGTLFSLTHACSPHLNLLSEPPTLDFYRALTDNDRGGRFGKEWTERRLHQTRNHFTRVTTTEEGHVCKIIVESRVAPPVLAWSVDTVTTYTLTSEYCSVHIKAKPRGPLLPDTFARFGLTFGLKGVKVVEWFGRGRGESYCDKKLSQHVNTWGGSVDSLFTDYELPQDCGNRTDVRWVELRDRWGATEKGRLLRARFGDHDGASFSAMHYTTKDLDESTHPYELHKRKREDTIVRLDWFHHGLGTGSCGPATLPQYELRTDREFDVELLLD